ncbi:MAG: glycoside hydrolase family 78 protein [Dysgonamonadaceae bacterium]|jgi:hypothetical protein|nr:glycoside hydrolase family 78 protein [Dysgonamonadaceae bacterium]
MKRFRILLNSLTGSLIFFALSIGIWGCNSANALKPTVLQCEYQTGPIGLEVASPRFGWQLSDPQFIRGQRQTAYHVLVASRKELLSDAKADVWNSGKVLSEQSFLVQYEGKPLTSSHEYFWKVQIYNKDGKPSPWSEPQRFVTGVLDSLEWTKAQWIRHPSANRKSHIWFRKDFALDAKPSQAVVAHVASLGHHELYVNGVKADDRVLAPALTDFQKRLFYVSYDISKLLRKGKNVVAVWFASGWASYDCFKMEPCLKVIVDGGIQTINTDNSWRCAESNSTDNVEIFRFGNNGGETVDARTANPAWNTADFDDSGWAQSATTACNVELVAHDIESSRIIETIPAQKITNIGNGKIKIDFGKNFSGWLNIKFHGLAEGDRITIGSADDAESDCDFNMRNFFISAGKDGEAFQNRFNYTAGRYATLEISKSLKNKDIKIEIEKALYGILDEPASTVDATEAVKKLIEEGASKIAVKEITKAVGDPKYGFVKTLEIKYKMDGKPQTVSAKDGGTIAFSYDEWGTMPRLEDCTALAVSTDLRQTGHFRSSNELFNRIYETDLWTLLANTQEGYTSDCPHRERCGYGEVATATSWGLGLPNYDAGAFYRNVVRNWRDVQIDDGWGRHTAPQPNDAHWGGAMWSSAGMNVAQHHYEHYGDRKIIETIYPTAKRWLEFLHANSREGLLCQYHTHNNGHFLGDWLAPGSRNEFGTSPEAQYFNNCVYAMNLETMIEFSKILDIQNDAETYSARLDSLRPAIHARFYRPDSAFYCTGTQVQNAFALLVGVTPESERARVEATLINDMNGAHPYFDMGSSGLVPLLKFLVAHSEYAETAARILNRTEYPGYGYIIDKGENTWTEDWKIEVPSKIHTCYTGIAGWFVKGLCGIQPDAEHPGYRSFFIKPFVIPDLEFAEAAVQSPYGNIKCRWEHRGEAVALFVTVPPGSETTVFVPTTQTAVIRESGKSPEEAEGVSFVGVQEGSSVYKVISGQYKFEF